MTQRPPTPRDLNPDLAHAEVMTGSGRLIDVPGEVALDELGDVVGRDDPIAQARRAFENLQHRLAAAEATMDNVVKLTYYVTDIDYLPEISIVAEEFINAEHPPAVTAVEVKALLRPEFLLQVEAIVFAPMNK